VSGLWPLVWVEMIEALSDAPSPAGRSSSCDEMQYFAGWWVSLGR
jgi:hypothetical protein